MKKHIKNVFLRYASMIGLCGREKYGDFAEVYKQRYSIIEKKHEFENNKNLSNSFLDSYFSTENNCFVEISKDDLKKDESDPLILAYYLTQFHETEINNENFGKGFTEWTNVAKAKQLFSGHYQPHIPIDVGFYDLAHDDVMYRQIELAKKYGVGGFCFYYYWFSGRRVLEKPLFNFLNNKELDIPFCLFWANETWERRWFGGNKEIILEHKFDLSMVKKFFDDILPFFKDKRYIKVKNKPLLIIYHIYEFTPDEFKQMISEFDKLAIQAGFDGIHFVCQGFKVPDKLMKDYGLHASAEFLPSGVRVLPAYKAQNEWVCPEFTGQMLDMTQMLDKKQWAYDADYIVYKSVFPSWDNTPRTFTRANIFRGITPEKYKNWLRDVIKWTKNHNDKDNQIIFINAWNEWGEGAHLEPDLKYGYAFLQATRDAIEEARVNN